MTNDFILAITGKPSECYRVHADIGNDKVGITAWYTIAVIKDVIQDINKQDGVIILGIEKQSQPGKLYKSVKSTN
jgi:hypothetical protein